MSIPVDCVSVDVHVSVDCVSVDVDVDISDVDVVAVVVAGVVIPGVAVPDVVAAEKEADAEPEIAQQAANTFPGPIMHSEFAGQSK
jgi:hypothetical protein